MIEPIINRQALSLESLQQSLQQSLQMPSAQPFSSASPAVPTFFDSSAFGREAAAMNGSAFNAFGENNPGAGNVFTQNGNLGAYASAGPGGAYAGPNGAYAGLLSGNSQTAVMQQYQQMMTQVMQMMMQMMQVLSGGQNNAVNGGNNAVNGGNNAVNGGNDAAGGGNNAVNGGNVDNAKVTDRPNGSAEITKAFGQPGTNQVTVQMPAGPGGKMVSVTCNAKIADKMKAAFEEVKSAGLSNCIKSFDGCFNNRNKRGGSSKSTHAWGIAFDVNAGSNPMGSSKMTDDQRKIAAIFEKHGFHQLPNDPMHFQYCTGY
ncbi:MAG: M15 family metallopeptidase [Vulcanimicrobiota bacterium]